MKGNQIEARWFVGGEGRPWRRVAEGALRRRMQRRRRPASCGEMSAVEMITATRAGAVVVMVMMVQSAGSVMRRRHGTPRQGCVGSSVVG